MLSVLFSGHFFKLTLHKNVTSKNRTVTRIRHVKMKKRSLVKKVQGMFLHFKNTIFILVNNHFITLFLRCLFVKSNIYFDYLMELKLLTRRVNIFRKQ